MNISLKHFPVVVALGHLSLVLGAPGADIAVRAVDRIAIGRSAVRSAALAGTLAHGGRWHAVLLAGSGNNHGLHGGNRCL